MKTTDIHGLVSGLKFTELQAYLRNTGWQRVETPKPNIALFQKQHGDEFHETVLPLDKGFGDYERRILDVLESISAAEMREVGEVISDLSIPPSDIVRFRIIGRETMGGTIPFTDGVSLLESAKKALFSTACDILQPEKYHKRLGLKAAQQFIEECRLGQTERGSFIASVICPFVNTTHNEYAQQLSLFNHTDDFKASFTRQVTRRMARALERIKTAIDRGEQDHLLELEGPETISGNFLESIVEFNAGREDMEIEIQTHFSVLAPEAFLPIHTIRFSNDYFPVIETIAQHIKPADDGFEDEFIGLISQTKADPDPHTRVEGEIVLNFITGDQEKVSKARVLLNKYDYDRACEAHIMGKAVKVTGKLVSSGRSKSIIGERFEVVA